MAQKLAKEIDVAGPAGEKRVSSLIIGKSP
jgi:hypothetical protein